MPAGISSDAKQEARSKGESFYQGQDCRKRHGGMRYVANGACVECTKAHVKLSYDTATATARKRAYRERLKAGNAAALGTDILDSM